MIEAYAFLAMFTLQILAWSVLLPVLLSKDVRSQVMELPAEHLAALYRGADHNKILERQLTWHRVMNTVIAVLGLLLLGGFFGYVRRPDWQVGPVEGLVIAYTMVQLLPIFLVVGVTAKYRKLIERLRERKRKTILQRRGLFDFVSPFTVFLAVSSYFLFVAYMIYLARNPFPGFSRISAISDIIFITLVYALNALLVYRTLYNRKINPLETHAARVYGIGLGVKLYVYLIFAIVVFRLMSIMLKLLDLPRWEPFRTSAYFVFFGLLTFIFVFTALRRRSEADDGFSGDISQQPTK